MIKQKFILIHEGIEVEMATMRAAEAARNYVNEGKDGPARVEKRVEATIEDLEELLQIGGWPKSSVRGVLGYWLTGTDNVEVS